MDAPPVLERIFPPDNNCSHLNVLFYINFTQIFDSISLYINIVVTLGCILLVAAVVSFERSRNAFFAVFDEVASVALLIFVVAVFNELAMFACYIAVGEWILTNASPDLGASWIVLVVLRSTIDGGDEALFSVEALRRGFERSFDTVAGRVAFSTVIGYLSAAAWEIIFVTIPNIDDDDDADNHSDTTNIYDRHAVATAALHLFAWDAVIGAPFQRHLSAPAYLVLSLLPLFLKDVAFAAAKSGVELWASADRLRRLDEHLLVVKTSLVLLLFPVGVTHVITSSFDVVSAWVYVVVFPFLVNIVEATWSVVGSAVSTRVKFTSGSEDDVSPPSSSRRSSDCALIDVAHALTLLALASGLLVYVGCVWWVIFVDRDWRYIVNLAVLHLDGDVPIWVLRTNNVWHQALRPPDSLPPATIEQLLAYDDVCAICCDKMADGEARVAPCRHVFHGYCLRQWLYVKQCCPICNRHID